MRPDVIQLLVASYGDVRPKLVQHQPGFPTADSLKAVIAEGNPAMEWRQTARARRRRERR